MDPNASQPGGAGTPTGPVTGDPAGSAFAPPAGEGVAGGIPPAGALQPPTYMAAPGWNYVPAPGWVFVPHPWWATSRPSGQPGTGYRPGPVMYLLSAAVVLVAAYGASFPVQNWMVGVAALAGLGIGVLWCAAFANSNKPKIGQSRREWARWAGIPMAGFLIIALMASNLPLQVRFALSQQQLQQAANQAQAGRPPSPGSIGLMPVEQISTSSGGVTTFTIQGENGCGLAHFSGPWPGDPSSTMGYTMKELAPGWWTWCPGYNSD
jgi:hypothetical protein